MDYPVYTNLNKLLPTPLDFKALYKVSTRWTVLGKKIGPIDRNCGNKQINGSVKFAGMKL
jgi:hypothetical protein